MSRASARRVHLLLGLSLALPLLAIVVTGALLGGLRAWDQANPYRGSRDVLALATAAQAASQTALKAVIFPESDRAPARVRLADGSELLFDPSTARPWSQEDGGATAAFVETLYRVHRGKAFGAGGQALASALGVLACVLFALGLMARNARARGGRASAKLHRRLGTFGGAFVALVMLLGSLANYGATLAEEWDPVPQIASTSGFQKGDELSHLSEIAAAAIQARAETRLESVHFGKGSARTILFYFGDSSRVYGDMSTGSLIKVAPWSAHWTRSLFALHTGRALGSWQPLWVGVVVLLSLGLIVTGLFAARIRAKSRLERSKDEKTQMWPASAKTEGA